MILLGIETATTVCAAAVVRDGQLLAEELIDERNVHAERLMGMIDGVLRTTGMALEQMDGIAVSIGPGSFTGLRIGLSVTKGLAYASGKPIVPVPTLTGLARKTSDALGEPDGSVLMILPLLDARRGDVYCALYRHGGGTPQELWDQRLMSLEAVGDAVHEMPLLLTGDMRVALGQMIQTRFPERAEQIQIVSDDVARCSAAAIARVGEQLLGQGGSADPELLEPQYLREFLTTTH
jgi:tRNA threonylcarbamoyladenosine biosynthesis protein TsaB